ncbi:MAG: Mur ligase family protein [Dehalococcoidia bacterium]
MPPSPRTRAAVISAKVAGALSRASGRGGGTAVPGLVAERLDAGVVAHLARGLGHGAVIVTGTNGKTTTARMLAGILEAGGLRVVHNRSGSNLMRGLAATFTAASGLDGRLPRAEQTVAVLEVDEATLPAAAAATRPRVVVFTNLFRDQLDRYGEVDAITALWRQALRAAGPATSVALNADDPSVATLRREAPGRVLTFGIDDRAAAEDAGDHPADSRWCAACGGEYAYTTRFFWHVGHWRCPTCDDARPLPDVAALRTEATSHGVRAELRTPAGPLTVAIPLAGLYNVYNGLAAATGAVALGVAPEAITRGLERFEAAFGRQETLPVRGREVQVLLCKNPAGVNQVLRTIAADPDPLHLLITLNDGIADGRDVSWIWDVDYETIAGRAALIVASGTRAADLALRLRYAGLKGELLVEPDTRAAVSRAVTATPLGSRLYTLPTYTAMLEVRERLARLAGGRRFWEQ